MTYRTEQRKREVERKWDRRRTARAMKRRGSGGCLLPILVAILVIAFVIYFLA